jgi:hypothetical protein
VSAASLGAAGRRRRQCAGRAASRGQVSEVRWPEPARPAVESRDHAAVDARAARAPREEQALMQTHREEDVGGREPVLDVLARPRRTRRGWSSTSAVPSV